MAENSILWDTNIATGDGAAEYTMGELVENWLRYSFLGGGEATDGVMLGALNGLAVTGTSSPVAVASGAAYVYGFPYWNTASLNVNVPAPASNTRVDVIALRADWSAQTVRIVRVAGTEGAGAPALTQSAGTTWEIPLANVSITTGGAITVTDRRGYCNFATQVSTAMIADSAVTTAKIANAAITAALIASGAVDTDELATDAVTTAKIAAGAVGSSEIANAAITAALIASGAVDTDKLATDAVTAAKIAADAVGSSEIASGAVGPAQIVDAAVTLAKLAANSVDDTKAGNRVPQFYRRQGGNATNWNIAGVTNQTPGAVRMQAGVIDNAIGNGNIGGTGTVTFPVAFSATPVVYLSPIHRLGPTSYPIGVAIVSHGAASFDWEARAQTTMDGAGPEINWLAIGPE